MTALAVPTAIKEAKEETAANVSLGSSRQRSLICNITIRNRSREGDKGDTKRKQYQSHCGIKMGGKVMSIRL